MTPKTSAGSTWRAWRSARRPPEARAKASATTAQTKRASQAARQRESKTAAVPSDKVTIPSARCATAPRSKRALGRASEESKRAEKLSSAAAGNPSDTACAMAFRLPNVPEGARWGVDQLGKI